MNRLFLKVSKIQTIFCFLITGGFIACGKEFVFMWLDDTRYQVYIIACIMMIVYSITCSNRLAIMARRVQNLHIKASLIYLGTAVFNIAFSLVLVNVFPKEYAIWCCLFGTVATYLIGHWLIMQIYDQKVTKLSIGTFFIVFLKYLFIAATIDIVVIRCTQILNINNQITSFFLKGCLFSIIYVLVVSFIEKELLVRFKIMLKNILKRSKKNDISN